MMDRMLLYKAVKHEVQEFFGDHGMTIPEMWERVSGDPMTMTPNEQFWYVTCLMDYEERRTF